MKRLHLATNRRVIVSQQSWMFMTTPTRIENVDAILFFSCITERNPKQVLCPRFSPNHKNANICRGNNGKVCIHGCTRWRSWLRHCATNREVAGSIPDGVIGSFQ